MKKINSILLICTTAILTILAGCASSGSGVSSNKTDNNTSSERLSTVDVDNGSISLDDYLRRVPGVNVRGSGANAQIAVQGISSFHSSTNPLFYIDETRVGRNFSRVHSMVNMYDVQSIKVFKGDEASVYGIQGSNGVIVIKTKKSG